MPKIIKQTAGYLSIIKDMTDKYSTHLEKPGLIIVGESEHKYPGKRFIYIYYNNDFTIGYFHTSCGTVEEIDNKLIFTSEHSRYEFTIDENCIDEVTKKEMLLNNTLFFQHY